MRYQGLLAAAGYAPFALGGAAAPNLLERIRSVAELSDVASIITGFPEYADAIANVTNVTFFAPSNAALARFGQTHSNLASRLSSDLALFSAIFDLHGVRGAHYTTEFRPGESWFLPTLLDHQSVVNLTTGQVVKIANHDGVLDISAATECAAQVIQKDLCFEGGALNVIDTVLDIPKDIESFWRTNDFNTSEFAQAIDRANLSTVLSLASDLTIFVPSNEAFEEVQKTDIVANDSGLLRYISGSHIVRGQVLYSNNLTDQTLHTLSGAKIQLWKDGEGPRLNGARFKTKDLLVANGVVHVVDSLVV